LCGIRFFFEQTLNRKWTIFNLVRPAPEHKLPVILSLEEVREILNRVRLPRYRVLSLDHLCLRTPSAGRHPPRSSRHRQRPDDDPCPPRQGQ
jgi:hypothetical protein